MSRIHEALKKAEQERASAPPSDVSVMLPSVETHIAVDRQNIAAGIAKQGVDSKFEANVPTSDYLRFDDLRRKCAHPTWHLDPNVNVFTNSALMEHGAEQFRTLRSRLYQIRNSQTLKTLLVTSSIPAEGKTFVTNNLAQAIVRQPDRRVLIIDADLRCSRLHVPLGAPLSPGLSEYLRGEADEASIVQNGLDGNLCFIAGGSESTHPSELLSNGRLKALIDRMTPVFDWIILDSPPLLPVADSSFLADMVDGVLLVVRAGVTPTATAQRSCQELQGRQVIGVVLNAVNPAQAYGSYYSSAYGYGYGYGRGQDDQPKGDRVQ
jgi:capsular exopolysaccharide synthesis family protein